MVENASQLWQQLVEVEPDNVGYLIGLARTARQANDLSAARDAITQAEKSAPGSGAVLLERAFWQRASRDPGGAAATLRGVVADCEDGHILWQAGDVLIELGEREVALAAFARAVDLNPKDPEAQARLARSAAVLGDLNQALAAYQVAITLDPGNPAHRGGRRRDTLAIEERGAGGQGMGESATTGPA